MWIFRDEILANNYGGISLQFQNRADWVVKVLEKNIDMQLLRKVHVPGDRRIFVYPYFIVVQPEQIHDKPTCLRGNVDVEDDTSSDDNEDGYGEGESEDEEYLHLVDDEDNENGEFITFESEDDEENVSGEFESFESEDESYAVVEEEIECYEYRADVNEDTVAIEQASGDEEQGFECGAYENGDNFCTQDEDESDECETSENGEGSYDGSSGDYETGDEYDDDLGGYYESEDY